MYPNDKQAHIQLSNSKWHPQSLLSELVDDEATKVKLFELALSSLTQCQSLPSGREDEEDDLEHSSLSSRSDGDGQSLELESEYEEVGHSSDDDNSDDDLVYNFGNLAVTSVPAPLEWDLVYPSPQTKTEILERLFQMPIEQPRKTVACLYRGTGYPSQLSVSGWKRDKCENHGALDRRYWVDRVFELANVVGHQLKEWPEMDQRVPGQFYASHAEKQLVPYLVETVSLPSTLANLPFVIYIWQDFHDETDLCDDCFSFLNAAAKYYRLTFALIELHPSGEETCYRWVAGSYCGILYN